MNNSLIKSATAVLVLALLAVAGSLQAETLTDKRIENFIASLQELKTMESEFQDMGPDMSAGAGKTPPDMSKLMSNSMEQIRGHEMYDKVEQVVEDHGFDSVEEWSTVGDRVLNAYMAKRMGGEGNEMQNEMSAAMREIQNNPDMSQAQKEQMMAMMGGAMKSVESMANAPEEDIKAIEPHMEALDRNLAENN
ncbi:hypothetical protein [Marinobacter salicampi]|uniref:hypothetical protein n=1 Tax=Marinobacter salicampi TaxID=435907 RepID=UPI00140C14DB|nr:hypothetical protein [Marinobacter salicampi]